MTTSPTATSATKSDDDSNNATGHRTSSNGDVTRSIVNDGADGREVVLASASTVALKNESAVDVATSWSRLGDVEKERQIETRLAELGLLDFKLRHERNLADMLDNHISNKDQLAAVLGRCRRRQRTGDGAPTTTRPIDDVKNIVQQKIIKDSWGNKVAYDIRLLMGCFTRNVSYKPAGDGRIITVTGSTPAADNDNADGKRKRLGNDQDAITLKKDISVELPQSTDPTRIRVTYSGGVVQIYAPVLAEVRWTSPLRSDRCQSAASPSSLESARPQFTSISPIYSLHRRLLESSSSRPATTAGAAVTSS